MNEQNDKGRPVNIHHGPIADGPMYVIVVRSSSEILGSDEFWRGPPDRVREIRNVVARRLAEHVAQDGHERKDGMWTVSRENLAMIAAASKGETK